MSMFSNDMRVANTATPSLNTNVNVGQMGWTNVDKSNYNQLIQYVNLCEQLYQDMSDQIALIVDTSDKVLGLSPKMDQVIESLPIINNSTVQVAANRLAVETSKAEFDTSKTDFDIKYLDFQHFVTPVTDDLDLQPSWTHLGPPHDEPRSVNIMNNVVYLRGMVKGTLGLDEPKIATLKTAYRPRGIKVVPVICSDGFVALEIDPDGSIKVIDIGGTATSSTYRNWLSLDCSFTL